MLDDELSDAPSRSATLYMTRQVIMHTGPGPARDPPGGGWRAISYPLDGADRSMFFYDAATDTKLGQWTLPRPQSSAENCTIHNYNVVPLRSGRYVRSAATTRPAP